MQREADVQREMIQKQKAEEMRYRVLNRKDPIPRVKRKQQRETSEPFNLGIGSLNSDRRLDDMLGGVLNDLDMPLPSLREIANREESKIMELNLVGVYKPG